MHEVIITCPLGSKCEEIKDNKMYRCAWYTHLIGKDPQSTTEIDKWDCAMTFMPIMMVENAQTNRGQTAAMESFRNEMVKSQDTFNTILISGINKNKEQILL